MTYEDRRWLKSEIQRNGWTPHTEYEDKPLDGELVELLALDMDGRIRKGTAIYEYTCGGRFLGKTIFPGCYVSRIMAWRRTEGSILTPESKYICNNCKWGENHLKRYQRCSTCRFNLNLKDNHEWV